MRFVHYMCNRNELCSYAHRTRNDEYVAQEPESHTTAEDSCSAESAHRSLSRARANKPRSITRTISGITWYFLCFLCAEQLLFSSTRRIPVSPFVGVVIDSLGINHINQLWYYFELPPNGMNKMNVDGGQFWCRVCFAFSQQIHSHRMGYPIDSVTVGMSWTEAIFGVDKYACLIRWSLFITTFCSIWLASNHIL